MGQPGAAGERLARPTQVRERLSWPWPKTVILTRPNPTKLRRPEDASLHFGLRGCPHRWHATAGDAGWMRWGQCKAQRRVYLLHCVHPFGIMLPHLPFSRVVPHGPLSRAAVQKSYGKKKSAETKQKSKTTLKSERAENTFSSSSSSSSSRSR